MSFKRFHLLQPDELEEKFQILKTGLEENAELDEMRDIVNSIDSLDKYKLMNMFLKVGKSLSVDIRLNCLAIFLDDMTKYFSFMQDICFQNPRNEEIIKYILEFIPNHCSTIELINFNSLSIRTEEKEQFKSFLKKCPQMQSLWVRIHGGHMAANCAMNQLLLIDDFEQHDAAVQIELLKITIIEGIELDASECGRILKILPNLRSFCNLNLGPVLPISIRDNEIACKLFNITYFCDDKTSLISLEYFLNLCPQTRRISLTRPDKYVISNLWRFLYLNELIICSQNPDDVQEIKLLLDLIGTKLQYLQLNVCGSELLNVEHIRFNLCRNLVRLEIKHTMPDSTVHEAIH